MRGVAVMAVESTSTQLRDRVHPEGASDPQPTPDQRQDDECEHPPVRRQAKPRGRPQSSHWVEGLLAVALALGLLVLAPPPSARATTPKPAPQSAPAVSGSE